MTHDRPTRRGDGAVDVEWVLLGLRILAALILYAFLAFIVYVIWRDLCTVVGSHRSEGAMIERGTDSLAWLWVVDETDAMSQPEAIFAVLPPATLGRAQDNQIVLHDEWISAYHARIDSREGKWWLTDLGSRNGTRLNDQLITEATPLTKGDIISIGRLKLRFETGDGTSRFNSNIS
ncbi:MAG: FHA domain-containing protein [Anaerolineae bacterium]